MAQMLRSMPLRSDRGVSALALGWLPVGRQLQVDWHEQVSIGVAMQCLTSMSALNPWVVGWSPTRRAISLQAV